MTSFRWLAAYAVVTFFAFPQPIGGVVVDLGGALAWLAPALLLLGVSDLEPRQAAKRGFLAGWLAHTAVLHWIWIVTVVYGHMHPALGVAGPLGLGAYLGLFGGAFAGIAALLRRGAADAGRAAWLASPLLLGAVWAALDHLRSFLFTGFPWATLGYALHRNDPLLAWVPFAGVYGLSFVAAVGCASLARIWTWRRVDALAGSGLALVLAAHAGGLGLRALEAPDPPETVRVAVLQGNIEQGVKWSRDWYARTLGIYEALSREAAARGAEVIVWPETAVPGWLGVDGTNGEPLQSLARETGAQLVVGAVGLERASGEAYARYFDSAFLVDPGGRFTDRYDKAHLVPFGEYLPFQDLLGRFFKAVARGIASASVTAGPRARAVEIHAGEARLPVGVPICYELLFPDLVRGFVSDGGELLFAITNDAWYGRTGAPFQFLAITAMRSAENRVWTARAANTGVSAIIDARGRVRERTAIFERDLLVADVPRRPAPMGGSFYARNGDWFAGACWLVTLAALGAARARRRRDASG
ncbi:MAG: apolipoprotein N-acyltransferase [Myxococcota bacterium]